MIPSTAHGIMEVIWLLVAIMVIIMAEVTMVAITMATIMVLLVVLTMIITITIDIAMVQEVIMAIDVVRMELISKLALQEIQTIVSLIQEVTEAMLVVAIVKEGLIGLIVAVIMIAIGVVAQVRIVVHARQVLLIATALHVAPHREILPLLQGGIIQALVLREDAKNRML